MKQVLVNEELLRQALDAISSCPVDTVPLTDAAVALRAALDAPAVEPVTKITLSDGKYLQLSEIPGWSRKVWCLHQQSGAYTRTLDTFETGFVEAALKAAPKAQQPVRDVPSMTVEQTLAIWEHDFKTPMTPEQQDDWVKRERDFAKVQRSAQPRLLTHDELRSIYLGNGFTIKDGQTDLKAYVFASARAVEIAVLKKNGML